MEHHADTSASPAGAPVSEPLRRSRSDRVLAGVAAGVARRIDLPPWLIRVLFVVLTITGGFGIALYLAGWLLIPEEGSDEPIVKSALGRGTTGWVGVVLIALAVLLVVDSIGFFRGDLMLAAVLIVAGVLLYRGEFGRGSQANARPGDEPPAADPPETPAPPPPAPPPPPPPPVKPARPPSPLGRLTVAVGMLVVGVMWLLDNLVDSFDAAPRHYLAVAVGVVGLGLVVSAFVGRARGLIVLGIFLVPVLMVAPIADFDYSSGIGDRAYRPSSLEDLDERYELGVGRLVVDLRDLALDGRRADVDIRLGIGELDVYVPEAVRVEVDARIGAGELEAGGLRRAGVGRTLETVLPGETGTLVLDVDVNIGNASVHRATSVDEAVRAAGDRTVVVVRPEDLRDRYDLGAGTLILDLSGLDLQNERRVSVDVGTGELRVIVPGHIGLEIDAAVGVGRMDLLGTRSDGFDLDGTFSRTDIVPVLDLDLEVGAGDLIVEER